MTNAEKKKAYRERLKAMGINPDPNGAQRRKKNRERLKEAGVNPDPNGAQRRKKSRERLKAAGLPVDPNGKKRDHKRNQKEREENDKIPTTFVGIDGEGFAAEEGKPQRYVLLAASDETSVYSPQGLTSAECVEYLLDLRDRARKGKKYVAFVTFSAVYDVNMILHDLPFEQLTDLQHGKTIDWSFRDSSGAQREIKIEYVRRKWLTLLEDRAVPVKNKVTGVWSVKQFTSTMKIFDAFGFFQHGFAVSLLSWGIGTPAELEFVNQQKARRETFNPEEVETIKRYNMIECKLLADMMTKLDQTLRAEGIVIRQWQGAGAISSKLLQMHTIKAEIERPDDLQLTQAINSAYFGGRIEIVQAGEFSDVYAYDVNSAYPSAMSQLPSLKNSTWKHVTRYDSKARWALWRVKWDAGIGKHPVSPFPFRLQNNRICWPPSGEGWYWMPEVKAVKEAGKVKIKVIEGWILTPESDRQPFKWIEELYLKRQAYKQAHDQRQEVLKLGLNSLYGKTAQRPYTVDRIPPYKSGVWAGLITSDCRAKVYRAACQDERAVVGFATDGVYTTHPLQLPCTTTLGEWDEKHYQQMLVLRAGVWKVFGSEQQPQRVRGFDSRGVNWEEALQAWRTDGVNLKVSFTQTQFIGIGGAILQGQDKHCQWVTSERVLTAAPSFQIALLESEQPKVYRLWSKPLDYHLVDGESVKPMSQPYNDSLAPDEETVIEQEQPDHEYFQMIA